MIILNYIKIFCFILYGFSLHAHYVDPPVPLMKGIVADDLKTIKHVMHCELYKLEKTSCFEQGQISAGGAFADEIMLGDHYVIRLCTAHTHQKEVQNFYNLISELKDRPAESPFILCLPLTIKLIYPRDYFSHQTSYGSIISMKKADGKSIYSYVRDPSTSSFTVRKIFSTFGKELGDFQNTYIKRDKVGEWKTLIHGDLHGDNIFCGFRIKKIGAISGLSISLIDCGCMGTGSAIVDALYFSYKMGLVLKSINYENPKVYCLLSLFYSEYFKTLCSSLKTTFQKDIRVLRTQVEEEMASRSNLCFLPYDHRLQDYFPKVKESLPFLDRVHQHLLRKI